MNVIIIEDEKPAARLLQRKLEKLGIYVKEMLHSVEESIQWFEKNHHPDLIFLDIQLSDGLSFEIFEKVKISSAIIFTTAYDEYALKAFKLNSIDYLLKPIDEEDLEEAIEKYKSRATTQKISIDFEIMKKMLINPVEREYKNRFTIKIGNQLKVVFIEEIECFFSENKGTYIHTRDNRDYLLDNTLEQIEAELDPKDFFRINRKFILPLLSVKEIQMHTNSRLKVVLPTFKNDEVIVARERVNDFKKWIG